MAAVPRARLGLLRAPTLPSGRCTRLPPCAWPAAPRLRCLTVRATATATPPARADVTPLVPNKERTLGVVYLRGDGSLRRWDGKYLRPVCATESCAKRPIYGAVPAGGAAGLPRNVNGRETD